MKKITNVFTAFIMLLGQALSVANVFAADATNVPFSYTYTGGCAEVKIGTTDVVEIIEPCVTEQDHKDGNINTNFNYSYDGSTVSIELQTLFTKRLTSAVINGVEYNTPTNNANGSFPSTPAQILEAISEQHIHYRLTVPYSDTGYTISTTAVENTGEYMTVGNFLWSYEDIRKGTDDYVGNGKLELVKVKYGGVEYTQDELNALGKGYMWWVEDPADVEGGAMLPYGAEVTARLLPNKGYQLTSFTLNGQPFTAQEEIGTYKFTIPRGNFHLGAHFTKVNDIVNAEANAITSGSIRLGSGEIANGTVRLDVSNATGLEPAEINDFKENAGDYNVKTILDISLFKTIFKGTAEESWDTQIDELTHEATITLELDESVNGNDVVIVHQKHDGTYEVIPTTYNVTDHTITFKTSSFSNYAIATRTISAPDTGIMTKESASAIESDILTMFSMFALFGVAIIITKKISL